MNVNNKSKEPKHRSTFAVLFYINRTKVRKDGMCQLLCKVSVNAQRDMPTAGARTPSP